MTGLNGTDIRLTSGWQLTQTADGDTPLCSGFDCLRQGIAPEISMQPGDLFYDSAFGWRLYGFIQSEDNELTRLEIVQWPRLRLQKRKVIVPENISISVSRENDAFRSRHTFRLMEENKARELGAVIGPVDVEVVESD